MAVTTYRPNYAPRPTARATARAIRPTVRAGYSLPEARQLLYGRGRIAARLASGGHGYDANLETVRRIGDSFYERWEDSGKMPEPLPNILDILQSAVNERIQAIRRFERDSEPNHLS